MTSARLLHSLIRLPVRSATFMASIGGNDSADQAQAMRGWAVAVAPVCMVLAIALVLLVIGLASTSRRDPRESLADWQRHHTACMALPEEIYHRDRARALRGFVRGTEGNPVPGALVQTMTLTSLCQLARSWPLSPASWRGLVEAETRADVQGRYEFPHLREGARMICASASGLAPDVQSMVVVQDGSGARVDFNLEKPRTLRIRLEDADELPRRVYLVPYRWWYELVWKDLPAGETVVELTGLGGPFKQGLIFVCVQGGDQAWRFWGTFDLDRSSEVTLSGTAADMPSPRDLRESASLASWESETSEAARTFFSTLTPLALFWHAGLGAKAISVAESLREGGAPSRRGGGLRGYGPGAFLPVLIESPDGRGWLEWTSSASEFELLGIAAGIYRVRAMNPFGRVSFARGLVAPQSGVAELASGLGAPVELDEPLSREFMGTVRWENGRPAEKAEMFLQDAANFRRFLRRVVTNRNGFFSVPNVPAGQYVAFALPRNDEHAMKSFVYPRVTDTPRETWLDFTLSPHRVVGRLPRGVIAERVQLVRTDVEGRQTVIWSVSTNGGTFEISNVPHGRYLARAARESPIAAVDSISFMVEKGLTALVQWSQ